MNPLSMFRTDGPSGAALREPISFYEARLWIPPGSISLCYTAVNSAGRRSVTRKPAASGIATRSPSRDASWFPRPRSRVSRSTTRRSKDAVGDGLSCTTPPASNKESTMSVEVRNLSMRDGSFQAVKDVSFEVVAGQLVALWVPPGRARAPSCGPSPDWRRATRGACF